jgi:hypothetical protein
MNINGILEQQNKLQVEISRNLIGQMKALKIHEAELEDMKVLPVEELNAVKDEIDTIVEDFARYMDIKYDLDAKIDKLILKVE